MKLLAPTLIVLLLLGCKCPKKSVEGDRAQTSTAETGLQVLLTDAYGGNEEEALEVFRSEGELKKFFTRINKTRKPGLAVPFVDFDKQIVLLYCPGKTYSESRYELKTNQNGDRILVAARELKPETPENAGALTMPFSLYTMPRTEKEVVLRQQ